MSELEQSTRCCHRYCDGPTVTIPGPQGAAGAAGGTGASGIDGRVPVLKTTEPFEVPLFGDDVTVAVETTDFLPVFPSTIRFRVAIGGVLFYLLSFTASTVTLTPATSDAAQTIVCKGQHAVTTSPPIPQSYRVLWGIPAFAGAAAGSITSTDQGDPNYVVGIQDVLTGFSNQLRYTLPKAGGYPFDTYYDGTLLEHTSVCSWAIVALPVTTSGFVPSWAQYQTTSGGFDDGVVQQIKFEQSSIARFTPRVENLEPTIQTIHATVTITLQTDIAGNIIATNSASPEIVNTVTAFDGTIDYGGVTGNYGSGFSAPPTSAVVTTTLTIGDTAPNWSPLVDGPGYVSVNRTQTGVNNTFSDPGPTNLSQIISPEGGASLQVTYRYKPFDGYFWFMFDVLSHFVPHSFKLESTGLDLPMASASLFDGLGYSGFSSTIGSFGCVTLVASDSNTYHIFRSRDPFYGGDGPDHVIVT